MGLLAEGAAAAVGPGGDGSATASLPSLSAGPPAPLRMAASPRGPGVSAADAGDGQRHSRGTTHVLRTCSRSRPLPVFLAAVAKRHRASCSNPPPPGQQNGSCL